METNVAKEKRKRRLCREELANLNKNELIDRIIQLEAHNTQLKNIISKHNTTEDKTNHIKKLSKPFDFSKCHYRRILLHVMYFGWDYQGLAVQEDSNQTIENHLFLALTRSCLIENRESSNYHRSGRTDKGVSAFGQVISISIRSKYPLEMQNTSEALMNELPYCKTLNRLLPKDIKAIAWLPLPQDKPDFSARFDCYKRQYKYYFPRCSLDITSMRDACSRLKGSNDYRNLCKMDVGNGVTEFTRHLLNADILPVEESDTEEATSMYYLLIEGNAFLWHQIRCIMGILLLIGKRKEKPDIIDQLLNVEKNPRKPQYNMALDLPLNLFRCSYAVDGEWIYDKEEIQVVISLLQGEWTQQQIKSTMIKEVITELSAQYSLLNNKEEIEQDANSKDELTAYSECLLQGVKPKIYTPLMERNTCSSLEERIEYYSKRRRTDQTNSVE